jgi:hypothetical protein
MLKHAWQTGGYNVSSPVETFLAVNQVCFHKLTSIKCKECNSFSSFRCAHCSECYCFHHFILEFHYHALPNESAMDKQKLKVFLLKLDIKPDAADDDEEIDP